MLITPAFAQAAGGGDTNSMLMSLLPRSANAADDLGRARQG